MSGTEKKTTCEGCVWRLETGDSAKVLCPFSICRREELRPMWLKERETGKRRAAGNSGPYKGARETA